MARTHDTCPLADFQRDLPELVESLKESGLPTVLTRDGKPELVVQSAEAYQELIDLVERAEALLAVEEGLESIKRGEGRPLREVMESMRAWVREGAP